MVYPAFAAEYDQIVSTSDGTLDVGIYTIPEVPNTEEPTKLKIDFLKSGTEKIQQHIDYRLSVTKDGQLYFTTSRLLHTSPGSITIPVEFSENGAHMVYIEMEGILFQPIPLETAALIVNVGPSRNFYPRLDQEQCRMVGRRTDRRQFVCFRTSVAHIKQCNDNSHQLKQGTGSDDVIPSWIKNNAGWWADGQIDDSFVCFRTSVAHLKRNHEDFVITFYEILLFI